MVFLLRPEEIVMSHQGLFLVAFNVFVVLMLVLDLGVFHRKSHAVKVKEALIWCAVWISIALLFNAGIYYFRGPVKALEFFTCYIIEYSLSVDNIFVFILIFSFFCVPAAHQHKVLFWGILGALIMRGIFIVTGVALISRFHWLIYIFGLFLVFTGIKMLFEKDKEQNPEKNIILKFFRKFMPVSDSYDGGKFFTKRAGRLLATPLVVALIVVETTDIIFAVDSVPAVLAITLDPFTVYTSNVLAILGLRSLYFALAGVMKLFHYLHYGLSAILIFVGAKMLLAGFLEIPIGIALGVVASILAISVAASIIWPGKDRDET